MSRAQTKKTKNTQWSILKRVRGAGSTLQAETASYKGAEYQRIDFKTILIHLLLVSLVAGLIYSPSIGFAFNFVDSYIIGPFASKIRETNFWNELVLQGLLNPMYQPWLKASFAQDLCYSAPAASTFRLINLGLHIISCMALYILTFRIQRHLKFESAIQPTKEERKSLYSVAFIASLIFACHPITSQSVAYIAGRGGVLTGLAILLALNFFLIGFWKNDAFHICTGYLGAFLFSLMALETSPEGFAVPMLLLLTAVHLYSAARGHDVRKERSWEIAILSALTIISAIAAIHLPASNEFSNNFGMQSPHPVAYTSSQFRGFLLYYLRCSIFPVGLSIEPPFFISDNFTDPACILGAIGYIGMAYLAWKKRSATIFAFTLGAVSVAFLPSIFILRSEYGSDERFYFPVAMICILGATSMQRLFRKNPRILIGAAIFFVTVLGCLTIWRESAWTSTLSIWKNAAKLDRSAYSRAMVALYEVEGEDAEKAKKCAEDILREEPNCQPANFALAKYYSLRKEYLAAKPYLLSSLKLCDLQRLNNFTRYQCSVSSLYALVALDDYSLPQKEIAYLLQNYPESDEVNYLAGKIALHQKKNMLAVGYLNKAFSFDKKNPDYALALGEACLESQDPTLIRNAYRTLRPMSHRIPSAHLRLLFGQAALEVGRPDECLATMDQTISMLASSKQPLKPEVEGACRYIRSIALKQLGKISESEMAKEEALRFDPKVATRVNIKIVKNAL
jgi:Tfp pilus assembly protein PilF